MPDRNRLVENQPRVGFLEAPTGPEPLLAAQLVKGANGVSVRIPYTIDPERVLDRWFHGRSSWGDDPDKTKYEYSPPSTFDFYDEHGSVALVGCRPTGGSITSTGVDSGRLTVRFALLGARNASRYKRVNGLQSEMDGLGTWMRLRSLDVSHEIDDDSRLLTATLRLQSPPPIPVSPALNLEVRPAYRFGPGEHPDETTITERMLIQTKVVRPREWNAHLDLHIRLRNLVRVAAWRNLQFLSHHATRDDDPARTLDGTSHGRQWVRVETSVTEAADKPSTDANLRCLFYFADCGRLGVGRWMQLSRDMARAVDPIVSLLDLEGATLQTHFAQLCIGLEALGFLLAREQGIARRRAGEESFRRRLERILDDCRVETFADATEWVEASSRAYRAVKHADNREADPAEVLVAYYKGIQIFRLWLAGRLGVRRTVVEGNRRIDGVQRVLDSRQER